jgi:hypothetical protein
MVMDGENTALERAQAIVDEIYSITANLSFTGADETEDDDIAAYVAMVDARAPLIEELAVVRELITPADRATDEHAEILRTIADIAEMDTQHRTFFENLRDEVRSALKEAKQGRTISSAYNTGLSYEEYSRFNKRN